MSSTDNVNSQVISLIRFVCSKNLEIRLINPFQIPMRTLHPCFSGNNSNKKSEKKKQPVEQVLTESIAELSVSETKTEEAKTENKTCELNGNISSSSSASNEV